MLVDGAGQRAWAAELRYTLQCIQEVRAECDRAELQTVRQAREAGLSWTDIATSLGVQLRNAAKEVEAERAR